MKSKNRAIPDKDGPGYFTWKLKSKISSIKSWFLYDQAAFLTALGFFVFNTSSM